MRIVTYNVEWMNSLFDDAGNLLDDDDWSGREDVTRAQQLAALRVVFQALDADAVLVIEAPNQGRKRDTVRALERFAADAGLSARRAVMGFSNPTHQEIALLFDPDKLDAHHDPRAAPDAPPFDGTYGIDLDIDATIDQVVFSKPPLELAVTTACGFAFRMIGAHLKSKAPHGTEARDEAMRSAIANRRKQLAQAIWLRARVAQHLDAEEPLIVLGDLNDGPGLDEYELLFGRSSVEIVLGVDGEVPLVDPHARQALERRIGTVPTTARFWIRSEGRYLQALLDYIMVSPDLVARAPRWRIWHPLDDPDCWGNTELRDALVTASDHFPVSLEIDL